MLVTIRRTTFGTLDARSLAWLCIEPAIQLTRAKNISIKSQIYNQLTAGQQALYMFWVLYGHGGNGVIQFYAQIEYLLAQVDIWSQLRDAFTRFGDNKMVQLVGEMEAVYCALVLRNPVGDLADVQATIRRLDATYGQRIPVALERIADYIRVHPEEFVQLQD
jgi:hypothetical protein